MYDNVSVSADFSIYNTNRFVHRIGLCICLSLSPNIWTDFYEISYKLHAIRDHTIIIILLLGEVPRWE
jgi:hypothetical protein